MTEPKIVCEAPAYLYNGSKGLASIPLDSDFLSRRTVFIDEPITADTANKFLKEMMYLSRSSEPARLLINCTGGEVNAGLLMYDVISSFSAPLDIYCTGQALSMAAVLFAAWKPSHRFILPHSCVLIHEVLAGGDISGSATSLSRISRSIMEVRDLVNSILARHTGKTLEQINTATSFDNVMNAEEAVKFGIADRIVTSISM